MPKITATGFQKKIMEANPTINKNKAERLAIRLKKRALAMQEQFDFYQELRILGIITDPTAKQAINNIERKAA